MLKNSIFYFKILNFNTKKKRKKDVTKYIDLFQQYMLTKEVMNILNLNMFSFLFVIMIDCTNINFNELHFQHV